MKKVTKVFFLFLAFVLPVSIFVFLKLFGRNEFDVAPLFVTEAPPHTEGCGFVPSLPYFVPDSIRSRYHLTADSLTVIFFAPVSGEELNQLDRIREQTASDPVQILESTSVAAIAGTGVQENPDSSVLKTASPAAAGDASSIPAGSDAVRRCLFFLDNDLNVVMLDRRGAIRGQYTAGDRDDMDRLLTEITIILKKY